MSWWRTGTLAVAGTIPVRSVTAPAILVRSEGHHPAGNWTAIPVRVYESGSGAAAAARAVPVRHPCRPRSPPRGRAGLDKGTLAMAPDQAERAGQKAARSATAAYGPSPLVKSGAPAITTSRSGVPGPSPAGHGGVRRNRRRKPPQTKSEQGMNPVQAVQKLDRPLHMRSEPAAAGTRMRWSGQVRPKGAFRLLGPVITWMGIRQEQRIWTSLKEHLEAAPPAPGGR